jgi:hypothetical protein
MITREVMTGAEVIRNYKELSSTAKQSLRKVLKVKDVDDLMTTFESKTFKDLEFPVLVDDGKVLGFVKHTLDSNYLNQVVALMQDRGFSRTQAFLIKKEISAHEVEVLPKDVYKSMGTYVVDLIEGTYYYTFELLRMICTNRSYVPDVSYKRGFTLPRSLESLHRSPLLSTAALENWSAVSVRAKLAPLQHAKITCGLLLQAMSIATRFPHSSALGIHKANWDAQALHILNSYELEYTKSDVGDPYVLLNLQPAGWKDTAYGTLSVYELWNNVTEVISRAEEESPEEDPKVYLDALINAGNILAEGAKRTVIAQPKKLAYGSPTSTVTH